MRGFSPILVPQSTPQDIISAPEHMPSSFTNHPSFNDANDIALTLAPITSMEESTDLVTQSSYTYPVSIQKLDRRHWFTVLHHRMSPVVGPCQPNVGPVIALPLP
jgi:hypothetical protein